MSRGVVYHYLQIILFFFQDFIRIKVQSYMYSRKGVQ